MPDGVTEQRKRREPDEPDLEFIADQIETAKRARRGDQLVLPNRDELAPPHVPAFFRHAIY